jgi:hypothetical protein
MGRAHVNPLLALRDGLCSDRWEEDWPQIVRQWRQQAHTGREQRRRARLAQRRPAAIPPSRRPEDLAPRHSAAKAARQVAERTPRNPGGKARRPAEDHPWRHLPVGRAVCLPRKKSSSAKI